MDPRAHEGGLNQSALHTVAVKLQLHKRDGALRVEKREDGATEAVRATLIACAQGLGKDLPNFVHRKEWAPTLLADVPLHTQRVQNIIAQWARELIALSLAPESSQE
eukprot:4307037-Pyramimonas_sp.AAC.1